MPNSASRMAFIATALGALSLVVMGAAAEFRWPRPVGACLTVSAPANAEVEGVIARLKAIDGVHAPIAVLRTELVSESLDGLGWDRVWLYASQADLSGPAFVPPDPQLTLYLGKLPDADSSSGMVLGYELARRLRLDVGDSLDVAGAAFRVAGIWKPSTQIAGNFAQVSQVALRSLRQATIVDHYTVLLEPGLDPQSISAAILRGLDDVLVVSPQWELDRATQMRIVVGLAVGSVVVLFVLVSWPFLAGSQAAQSPSVVRALLGAAVGLAVGTAFVWAANAYTTTLQGSTAARITPRLVSMVLALASLEGLVASWARHAPTWQVQRGIGAALLCLAVTLIMLLGSLRASLLLSHSEARRTASDWVAFSGWDVEAPFLRAVAGLPGVRGYSLESGPLLANPEEDRWVGLGPSSGFLFGVDYVGMFGALSVPYELGFEQGRPLNLGSMTEAVVGYELARAAKLEIGSVVQVRRVPFTVVGIRERLVHDPANPANYRVDIPLEALRRVVHDAPLSGQLTVLLPSARDPQDRLTYLAEASERLGVGPASTVSERLAQITAVYPGVTTRRPMGADEAVRHATDLYTAIFWLAGIVLLGICALALATMAQAKLAADELKIALQKAYGRDESSLLADHVQMACLTGLAGSVPGLLFGGAAARLVNSIAPAGSITLLPTPGVAATAFFLSVMTSIFSVAIPVVRALERDSSLALFGAPLLLTADAPPQEPTPVRAGNLRQGGSEV